MASESKQTQGVEKTSPTHMASRLEDMERMLGSFFRRDWLRPWHIDWPSLPERAWPFNGQTPKVDVVDRETEVMVRAEIPGVDKKDIEVSVSEDSVTIKGSTRREEKEEKGDYYRHELSTGSFSRTVGLPTHVDGTRAKASFKEGMLELVIPKAAQAKRHSVTID